MRIESKYPEKSIELKLTNDFEFCNHTYMCIKQKGMSEYQIPDNLQSVVDPILAGVHELSSHLYENDWLYNCYLTIKHEFVNPGSIGNRPGWHIDGFLSDQYNFIWCDALPTEICQNNFELTLDHKISLQEMLIQSAGNNAFHLGLSSNVLYELNQHCVHRPTVNKTSKAILRTFIKVTFSKEDFNCIGNAWNYKLPHIKPHVSRSENRNHAVL